MLTSETFFLALLIGPPAIGWRKSRSVLWNHKKGLMSGKQLGKLTKIGMRVKQPGVLRVIDGIMSGELGLDAGQALARGISPVGLATSTGGFIQWRRVVVSELVSGSPNGDSQSTCCQTQKVERQTLKRNRDRADDACLLLAQCDTEQARRIAHVGAGAIDRPCTRDPMFDTAEMGCRFFLLVRGWGKMVRSDSDACLIRKLTVIRLPNSQKRWTTHLV